MKIIVHGAGGRMGQVLCDLIEKSEKYTLAAKVSAEFETDEDNLIFKNIKEFKGESDIIIDFSHHSATEDICSYAKEKSIPLIIATTGHTEEEIAIINETASSVAVFKSGNMSLGIALVACLAKIASKTFPDADIEIIEKHHNQKIDAPSGTAKLLYDVMSEDIDAKPIYDRSEVHHKREKNEIGIQSMRGGTIFGEHTIMFAGKDEIVEVKHTALSKEVFAQGAIAALKAIYNKENGLFTLKNLY